MFYQTPDTYLFYIDANPELLKYLPLPYLPIGFKLLIEIRIYTQKDFIIGVQVLNSLDLPASSSNFSQLFFIQRFIRNDINY